MVSVIAVVLVEQTVLWSVLFTCLNTPFLSKPKQWCWKVSKIFRIWLQRKSVILIINVEGIFHSLENHKNSAFVFQTTKNQSKTQLLPRQWFRLNHPKAMKTSWLISFILEIECPTLTKRGVIISSAEPFLSDSSRKIRSNRDSNRIISSYWKHQWTPLTWNSGLYSVRLQHRFMVVHETGSYWFVFQNITVTFFSAGVCLGVESPSCWNTQRLLQLFKNKNSFFFTQCFVCLSFPHVRRNTIKRWGRQTWEV